MSSPEPTTEPSATDGASAAPATAGAGAGGGASAGSGIAPSSTAGAFVGDKHRAYVRKLGDEKDTFEYCVTEHLRMSGVYWGVAAMDVMQAAAEMKLPDVADWVMTCYNAEDGGFGGNVGHDSHMLYTLSAVQLLAMCDALDRLDKEAVLAYVAGLQDPESGCFTGDKWGEVDMRFSYCALNCVNILGRPDAINVPKAVEWIVSCRNFDGGFGASPGAESHAAYVFCAVGALSIAGAMEHVDADVLGWWLCERQCDSGGLNGRPEKQADVCYSWWILSALALIGRLDWIDRPKLVRFIVACQDSDDGGIADRPGNIADVFHTFFGIAGLSLLGFLREAGIPHKDIDPAYALTTELTAKLGLKSQVIPPPPSSATETGV